MFSLVTLALLVGTSQAFFGKDVYPDWDELSVTFTKFSKMPMTAYEAKNQGWTQNDDGCKGNAYKGRRYALNGEMATMLLFDVNGRVAGIQMAVPSSFPVPKGQLKAHVKVGDQYLLTAYFTDPEIICNNYPINNNRVTEDGYVGDKLFLAAQDGIMEIPLKESDIGSTKWTKGKCFYGMGQHYWYNITKDMSCENFAPFFLLYNGGNLNGFGFATFGDLDSDRVENPPQSAIRFFFEEKPVCIEKRPYLTTQHVYLQRRPYLNLC